MVGCWEGGVWFMARRFVVEVLVKRGWVLGGKDKVETTC